MLRKAIFPLIYVGEWVLFFSVLLFIFVFNTINLLNLIYVDMPWEEPISLTSSFQKSVLIVLGMALIIYFYTRYLTGNKVYKITKEVIWGFLLGLNSLSCMLWLSVSNNLSSDNRILLLLITLISIILTLQLILKLRKDIK